MLSLFIDWEVSPEIFHLGGISVRYYGLLFALAFVFGYKVEETMFKSEGLPIAWLDKLWIYVAVATIVGARLGHCIFYDWAYYSQHPLEMILPVRFYPEFEFTGYQGLASHGAAIGIIAGLWYYSRKVSKKSIFWILDRAVIPIALAGFFIRMGNLMNSEIVGAPTTVPWGFHFLHNNDLRWLVENNTIEETLRQAWVAKFVAPLGVGTSIDELMKSGIAFRDSGGVYLSRHPAQLYEAICYLVSFGVLLYLYWKTQVRKKMGFIFGMFLILIFSARFVIEFFKDVQENFEITQVLNMGQRLSIPFILAGVFMLWYSKRLPDTGTKIPETGKKSR